jgi:hypothetical protein
MIDNLSYSIKTKNGIAKNSIDGYIIRTHINKQSPIIQYTVQDGISSSRLCLSIINEEKFSKDMIEIYNDISEEHYFFKIPIKENYKIGNVMIFDDVVFYKNPTKNINNMSSLEFIYLLYSLSHKIKMFSNNIDHFVVDIDTNILDIPVNQLYNYINIINIDHKKSEKLIDILTDIKNNNTREILIHSIYKRLSQLSQSILHEKMLLENTLSTISDNFYNLMDDAFGMGKEEARNFICLDKIVIV